MNRESLSLYLVMDAEWLGTRSAVDFAIQAMDGGVTFVQWRDKQRKVPPETVRLVAAAVGSRSVPFVINDDVELALQLGVGVHVGQSDALPAFARQTLGRSAIVGLSVTGVHELDTVDPAVVDYVGFGPVFTTTTKPDATPATGLEALRHACSRLQVPVVAIGGISAANAALAISAGAAGVAVVSAICGKPDPRSAARELELRLGLRERP